MTELDIASRATESAIFGPTSAPLFDMLRALVRDLEHTPVRYEYMSEADFKVLITQSTEKGRCVHITELLYHSHFAAVATLVRSYRWAEGCIAAYERQLFLPFCASARGLLEAVADSYDGFVDVPLWLSRAKQHIELALAEEPQQNFPDFKRVEDTLLHFSHARRLGRGGERKSLPEYVLAKELRPSIEALDMFEPGGFSALYSSLCELTHPASDSVCYLLTTDSENHISFAPSIDSARLTEILDQHRSRMARLLHLSIVPAMVMLKVLLHLPLPAVQVKRMRGFDLEEVQLWRKCAALLRA